MQFYWIQHIIILFALFFARNNCYNPKPGPFPILIDSYIFDLYKFIYPESLSSLSKPWKLNGVFNSSLDKTTRCGAFSSLFGGFGLLKGGDMVERTYESLPSHTIVFYYIKVILIDEWRQGDMIELLIDNHTVSSFQPSQILAVNSTFVHQCGNPIFRDVSLVIAGASFHSSSSLTFSIRSHPINFYASFGFTDLRIRFKQSTEIDTEFSYIKSNYSEIRALPNVSSCPNNYYLMDGAPPLCKNCHSSCEECTGPTSSDCIVCPNYYTYDINTDACTKCNDGCVICKGSNPNQCTLCQESKILYWNYTCGTSCSAPYVTDALNLTCMTPCQVNDTYMLWDNSCSENCLVPLTLRIEGKAKFCDSPCGKFSGDFLYWDGSCQHSCDFFPRIANGFLFCDACSPGHFMFPNRTCSRNCNYPFRERIQGGSFFCDYPCDESAKFFDQEKKVCKQTCDYPYQVYNEFFCVLNLSEEQQAQVKVLASTLFFTESSSNSVGTSLGIVDFGNPSSVFVNAYINMFKKIKYMRINYPPKLLYFFKTSTDEKFIKMSEKLSGLITKSPLPANFDKYPIHSNFIVNFYQEIIIMSIIGTIIALVFLTRLAFKTSNLLEFFCAKVSRIFKWNFFLTLFTSYFGDMVLFTYLEMQTAEITTTFSIISFIIGFFINLLAFTSLIKIIMVLLAHWDFVNKRKTIVVQSGSKDIKSIQDSFIKFEVIFKELETKSIFQQAFMFLFVGRVYVYSAVIGYFNNYPLFQTISITILSLSMILYLILTRPLRSKIDFGQFLMQEIVALVVAICTLVLSVFDKIRMKNVDDRERLGEIILYCNIAYNGITIAYLLLRIIIKIKKILLTAADAYRKRQSLDKRKHNPDTEQEFMKETQPQAPSILQLERARTSKNKLKRQKQDNKNLQISLENI